MAVVGELAHKVQRMRRQPCHRRCSGCEGCNAYSAMSQKCLNCAPEFSRCQCRQGKRVWLAQDGFIKMKDFGTADPSGRRVDLGPVINVRQICPPLPPGGLNACGS